MYRNIINRNCIDDFKTLKRFLFFISITLFLLYLVIFFVGEEIFLFMPEIFDIFQYLSFRKRKIFGD